MCSKANDLARHAAFSKELYIHIDMAMHSTVHESLVDRGWAAGTKTPAHEIESTSAHLETQYVHIGNTSIGLPGRTTCGRAGKLYMISTQ
jgi:hypothetical protein